MESTRLAPPIATPLGAPREVMDALIEDVVRGDRTAAERLPVALKAFAVQHPTAETNDYLKGLLEAKVLDGCHDAQGLSCRAAVIHAQLALGFPHALEVNPEDLVWLRDQTALQLRRPNVARVVTASLAVGSAGWSALAFSVLDREPLMQAPFVVGGIHALSAMVVTLLASPQMDRAARRGYRALYRVLAKSIWLGPLFALGPAIVSLSRGSKDWVTVGAALALVSLLCALPAMATALAAGLAGERLVPEDENEPPVGR